MSLVTDLSPKERTAVETRTRRKDRALSLAQKYMHIIALVVFLAGLAMLAYLPVPSASRGHYISENALQPGHVNVKWNWADVHVSSVALDEMRASGKNASQFAHEVFASQGLESAVQKYTYRGGDVHENAYAIVRSQKTDGAEVLALSASVRGRDGRLNEHGIALLLGLGNFLTKYKVWSKDILLIVSDEESEGLAAFLHTLHGVRNPFLSHADPIALGVGSVWAAVHIDMPAEHFSNVGLFYEGLDGQMPNLDLVNAVSQIILSRGVQVTLHDDRDEAKHGPFWSQYYMRLRNMARQLLSYSALGHASGPEGAYGRHRIDAVCLYAVPSSAGHSVHEYGQILESTLRSMNNILERFHQSFFLYIMTTARSFISVGNYVGSVIVASVGVSLRGIGIVMNTPHWVLKTQYMRLFWVYAGALGVSLAAGLVLEHGFIAHVPLFAGVHVPLFALGLFALCLAYVHIARRACCVAQGHTKFDAHTLAFARGFNLITLGMIVVVTATINFGASVPLVLMAGAAAFIGVRGVDLAASPAGVWLALSVLAPEWAAHQERWLASEYAMYQGYAIELYFVTLPVYLVNAVVSTVSAPAAAETVLS